MVYAPLANAAAAAAQPTLALLHNTSVSANKASVTAAAVAAADVATAVMALDALALHLGLQSARQVRKGHMAPEDAAVTY